LAGRCTERVGVPVGQGFEQRRVDRAQHAGETRPAELCFGLGRRRPDNDRTVAARDLGQRIGEARLADARLATDRQDRSAPSHGTCDSITDQLEFTPPPDQVHRSRTVQRGLTSDERGSGPPMGEMRMGVLFDGCGH
jgi:hypothetical protein